MTAPVTCSLESLSARFLSKLKGNVKWLSSGRQSSAKNTPFFFTFFARFSTWNSQIRKDCFESGRLSHFQTFFWKLLTAPIDFSHLIQICQCCHCWHQWFLWQHKKLHIVGLDLMIWCSAYTSRHCLQILDFSILIGALLIHLSPKLLLEKGSVLKTLTSTWQFSSISCALNS